MVRQTAAVLWRTLVVQCIKRHYVNSMLELLSVVLLAIAFLSSNFGSRPGLKEIHLDEVPLRAPKDTTQGPIYYAPNTEYIELLMNTSYESSELKGFPNEEELLDNCESTGIELCVYFSQSGSSSDGDLTLSYKLHFFESEPPPKDAFQVDFRYPKEFYYEQEYDKPQFGTAFQAQLRINTAHLQLQGESGDEVNITTRRIPMPRFPVNIEHYRAGLFWFLVVSFLYPIVKQICRICSERSSGLMEYQRLMGLSEGAFWAGHFACGFCFCLVHSAVCVYCGSQTRQPTTGVAFLDSTDASMLYVVMLVHSALQMLTAMLIACAAPSVWSALLCAFVVCLLLPSWAFLSFTGSGSLAEFVFQNRAVILLSSLLPSMATYNVLTILGIHNDFDGSAGWENIGDLALGVYSVTIADIWMVNFLTVVAMVALIFYLSNVLPWNSPIPLHPLYFLKPSYWQADPTVRVPPYIPLDYSDKRFEPPPWLLRPVVHVEDVTMVYGSAHALRRINLQAYEQEATAVVGRNGAGKTTLINIVAGLVKPTVGSVFVRGYDIARYTKLARSSVSYCPQRDLLFSDMTVWEHLLFFGAVKEMRPREIRAAAEASLERTSLGLKARELTDELSRGEKKRLGIAIATIAEPKLLIVDEPTSGLDPSSARSIWDLLLRVRITSTLLFSTHDMAEADVLADRVIGLSAGTIVCNASPQYLKSTYGVGYRIHIGKLPAPAEFRVDQLLSTVQRRVPTAEMIEDSARRVTLALHTVSPNGLDRLFLDLETLGASLGIASIRLTVCTLKDIYLRLILDSISLSHGTTVLGQQWPSDLATVVACVGQRPSTWAQVQVLCMERFLFARRRCTLITFAFVAPTLLVLVALRWMANGAAELSADSSHDARSDIVVPVSLGAHYPGAVTFLDDDTPSRLTLTPFYQALVRDEEAAVGVYNGTAQAALLDIAETNYIAYTQYYVFGAIFRNGQVQAWFNPYAMLSKSIAFDLVSSALLRLRTGDSKARFRTLLVVHIVQTSDVDAKSPSDGGGDARPALSVYIPMESVHALVEHMVGVWSLLAPLAAGLFLVAFVAFPSAESSSLFIILQLMTGIPGWLHCLVNWVVDLLLYFCVAAAVSAVFVSHCSLSTVSYNALLALLTSFSVVSILLAHLIAYCAQSSSRAYLMLILFFIAGGLLSMQVTRFFYIYSNVLPGFCRLLPPCSLLMGVVKVVTLEWVQTSCQNLAGWRRGNLTSLVAFCREVFDHRKSYEADKFPGLAKEPIDMCCLTLNPSNDVNWSPFQMYQVGVGLELASMLVQGFLLLALISWRHSGRTLCRDSGGELPEREGQDPDVYRETQAVQEACRHPSLSGYVLVAEGLHKWFRGDHSVRGFSVALQPGECFGLLGVKNCGKSTTVHMLAGLSLPTLGECHMADAKLSWGARAWQSRVGYCHQEDTLMDDFTAVETLQFFARLRGVPGDKIDQLVYSLVRVVDLTDVAHRQCREYSWSARRKLSTALAIVGLPRVVLLDDATTGIDSAGREMIYEALRHIREAVGCAIFMTSYSTEECEATCSRVGLMAGGKLKALGTVEHLRDKFGDGCALTFRLLEQMTVYLVERIHIALTTAFPSARHVDYREGVFLYYISNRCAWSEVFSRLAQLKRWFRIDSVLVSDCSLDEIFVGMARADMAEDAAEAKEKAVEATARALRDDPWGRNPQNKRIRQLTAKKPVRTLKGARKNSDKAESA